MRMRAAHLCRACVHSSLAVHRTTTLLLLLLILSPLLLLLFLFRYCAAFSLSLFLLLDSFVFFPLSRFPFERREDDGRFDGRVRERTNPIMNYTGYV